MAHPGWRNTQKHLPRQTPQLLSVHRPALQIVNSFGNSNPSFLLFSPKIATQTPDFCHFTFQNREIAIPIPCFCYFHKKNSNYHSLFLLFGREEDGRKAQTLSSDFLKRCTRLPACTGWPAPAPFHSLKAPNCNWQPLFPTDISYLRSQF